MTQLFLAANPSLVIPNPNPLVAESVQRQHEGAESHATMLIGNVRSDKALNKMMSLSIIHTSQAPIYNLTLTRSQALASWLDSANVNFLGTPLPMIYPAGIQKFGIPFIGALPELSLPGIGLPSLPLPSFSFPLPNLLQYLTDLLAFFTSIGNQLGAAVQNFLNAILQDFIQKIKLALPTLSLSVPIEWFTNLLFKLGPVGLLSLIPNLMSLPALVWPRLAAWPGIQLGTLPDLSDLNVDLSAVQDIVNSILNGLGRSALILFKWLAALGDQLGSILGAMLTNLSIPISFGFPGVDLGQLPPPGTPWPGPPPAATAVVPLVSWPEWMRAPLIANIPGPLPPGTSMAVAPAGVVAMTSISGYVYQAFFDVRVKSGLAPGMYTQEFYLEGTLSPTGTPLSKMAKITLVAQVLEPTLSPGIRPFGALRYG